jgi:flagellar biosynthetic protein FliR
LIPPGQMLPAGDSSEIAIHAVGTGFALAVQLASPFVVIAIVWHLAVGLVGRVVSRMQIYFVSKPRQILAGLAVLMLAGGAIMFAWRDEVQAYFIALPGGS